MTADNNCSSIENHDEELLNAIEYGIEKKVAILLLCKETNVNAVFNRVNDNGLTPLIRATRKGNSKIVRLLLDHSQIDVNKMNTQNRTALWFASSIGNAELFRLLLHHYKVDVNKEDGQGITPLHIASEKGRREVIKLLIDDPNIDVNKYAPTCSFPKVKLNDMKRAILSSSKNPGRKLIC